MSDTPNNADALMRLLDNGWKVTIHKNALGSYTATCYRADRKRHGIPDRQITDDFTPSQALYRLAEKMIGNIA